MNKYTAHEIAAEPDLYGKVYTIGNSKIQWECAGYTPSGKTVKFYRIEPIDAKNWTIKVITIYLNPDKILCSID